MRRKYLHLTGGLGNQLFQLAAGLSIAGDGNLLISEKNGKPRTNSSGQPELFSFILPNNVRKLEQNRFSNFNSRTCGYVIRMGVNPRKLERLPIIESTIRFAASVANSIFFKDIIKVMKVNGVGYAQISSRSNMLIGYFQSFKYAEHPDVFEKLSKLRIKNPGPKARSLIHQAEIELPLIIHLRRGDYSSETSFGLLGAEYYLSSVNELLRSSSVGAIWVFTDDLQEAESLFQGRFDLPTRFIDDVDGSASASLEVMRYGKAYIIGNSSFSWWAAFLRYDTRARVIAPKPWFIAQDEPKYLIPQNWERLNGHHYVSAPVQLESDY
jgi:hypothetical protein